MGHVPGAFRVAWFGSTVLRVVSVGSVGTSPFSSLDSDRAARKRTSVSRSKSGCIELSLASTQEFNVYCLLLLENFTPTTRVVEGIKSGLIYHSTRRDDLRAVTPKASKL